MPLTCNIDARGKRVRLINGVVLLILGVALSILWVAYARSLPIGAIAAFCILGGAFCVFEARAGWCAMRAMGFKTKV